MGIFDWKLLRSSVDTLVGQVRAIATELETLKREREDIAAATAAKEDVIEHLNRRIDAVAAEYPSDLTRVLGGFLQGDKTDRLSGPTFGLGALLPQANGAGTGMSAQTLMHGLAFLLRDQLKASVLQAINAAAWPENTLPLAERRRRLADLDDRIGKLEAQEAEMREKCAAAGIALP